MRGVKGESRCCFQDTARPRRTMCRISTSWALTSSGNSTSWTAWMTLFSSMDDFSERLFLLSMTEQDEADALVGQMTVEMTRYGSLM